MVMTMISGANGLLFSSVLRKFLSNSHSVYYQCHWNKRYFFVIGGGRGKINYSKALNETSLKIKDSEKLARL